MSDRNGFTIIEMVIAIVILSAGVLGLGASAGFMVHTATDAGVRAEALQAVEGRLSMISMDPRYHSLNSLYGGTETDLPGLEGLEMVTAITHTRTLLAGQYTDYKSVMVTVVAGSGLGQDVSRTIILGAP